MAFSTFNTYRSLRRFDIHPRSYVPEFVSSVLSSDIVYCRSIRRRGHHGCVNCLAFSPNGRYLVSGSDDTRLLIWDNIRVTLQTPAIEINTQHRANIFSCSFDYTQDYLLSGGYDGQVIRTSIQTPTTPMVFQSRISACYQAEFVPQSNFVAFAAFEDGIIRVIDFRSNKRDTFDGYTASSAVYDVSVRPLGYHYGQQIAYAGENETELLDVRKCNNRDMYPLLSYQDVQGYRSVSSKLAVDQESSLALSFHNYETLRNDASERSSTQRLCDRQDAISDDSAEVDTALPDQLQDALDQKQSMSLKESDHLHQSLDDALLEHQSADQVIHSFAERCRKFIGVLSETTSESRPCITHETCLVTNQNHFVVKSHPVDDLFVTELSKSEGQTDQSDTPCLKELDKQQDAASQLDVPNQNTVSSNLNGDISDHCKRRRTLAYSTDHLNEDLQDNMPSNEIYIILRQTDVTDDYTSSRDLRPKPPHRYEDNNSSNIKPSKESETTLKHPTSNRPVRAVNRATFSNDGNLVLLLRRRDPPLIYHVEDPRPLFELRSEGFVNSKTLKTGCWLPDDRHIAIGSENAKVHIWKLPEYIDLTQHAKDGLTEIIYAKMQLTGHSSIVNCCAASPKYPAWTGLPFLASSGIEKMIRLWLPTDLDKGTTIDHADQLLPDGRFVCEESTEDPRILRMFRVRSRQSFSSTSRESSDSDEDDFFSDNND